MKELTIEYSSLEALYKEIIIKLESETEIICKIGNKKFKISKKKEFDYDVQELNDSASSDSKLSS